MVVRGGATAAVWGGEMGVVLPVVVAGGGGGLLLGFPVTDL